MEAPQTTSVSPQVAERVRAIRRPESQLMTLYVLQSLLFPPLFPFLIVPLYFRYHTMRYKFDDEGISVSWGILFRQEHHLTYQRIQDIHVNRNILERWLGIGTVSVQTASGSGAAEAQIVGVSGFEEVRDFLYSRMRGLDDADDEDRGGEAPVVDPADEVEEAVALLREIRDALGDVRTRLERLEGTAPPPPDDRDDADADADDAAGDGDDGETA